MTPSQRRVHRVITRMAYVMDKAGRRVAGAVREPDVDCLGTRAGQCSRSPARRRLHVAYVDGTFYDGSELCCERDLAEIRHRRWIVRHRWNVLADRIYRRWHPGRSASALRPLHLEPLGNLVAAHQHECARFADRHRAARRVCRSRCSGAGRKSGALLQLARSRQPPTRSESFGATRWLSLVGS